jgi:hypothetical protein
MLCYGCVHVHCYVMCVLQCYKYIPGSITSTKYFNCSSVHSAKSASPTAELISNNKRTASSEDVDDHSSRVRVATEHDPFGRGNNCGTDNRPIYHGFIYLFIDLLTTTTQTHTYIYMCMSLQYIPVSLSMAVNDFVINVISLVKSSGAPDGVSDGVSNACKIAEGTTDFGVAATPICCFM